MKTQYPTLQGFVAEIERRNQAKADYLVPSTQMSMMPDDEHINIDGVGLKVATKHFHNQVAERLKIPKAYYDAMTTIPGLRAHNVNEWFKANDEKRFIRTLDNTARAYLSDRFRPIDDYLILSAALPVLSTMPEIVVKASALSEKRMYIEIANPRLQAEVKRGDVVQAGFALTNSEVGAGSFDIKGLLWRCVCNNGLIQASMMRQYHAGKRIDEESMDIYSNETIRAEMKSLQLRMRDIIAHAFTEAALTAQVEKLRIAAGDEIKKPNQVVENITKHFTGLLTEAMRDAIIENMANEGNMNRYGLSNAITHLAHTVEDADKAYELEKAGGKVIELTRSQWEVIAA